MKEIGVNIENTDWERWKDRRKVRRNGEIEEARILRNMEGNREKEKCKNSWVNKIKDEGGKKRFYVRSQLTAFF